MNKREAKRVACLVAHRAVEGFLDRVDLCGAGLSDDDVERIERGLDDISQELFERGSRGGLDRGFATLSEAVTEAGVKGGR